MKESTKNAFDKLAKLTCNKCVTCPVSEKFRCCDAMFCKLVEAQLVAKGLPVPTKPNTDGIPFMSATGCVVSPELRPYCTGFVCPPHFEDRPFRREYIRLIKKINSDKDAPNMPAIMQGLFKRVINGSE